MRPNKASAPYNGIVHLGKLRGSEVLDPRFVTEILQRCSDGDFNKTVSAAV